MTQKEIAEATEEQIEEITLALAAKGNMTAAGRIREVREWYGKRVRVFKGRKVPKGTEGEVFWIGWHCHSPYGDPWGIYTTTRIGLKDDDGNVFWTALANVQHIEEGGQYETA